MLGNDIALRKKKEYGYVFRAGKKQVGRFMVIYAAKNGLQKNRYGIITSKKVGKAVTRNRAKRRLRDLVRNLDNRLKPGFDIVIIARVSINEASFSDIIAEGEQLFKKVGL